MKSMKLVIVDGLDGVGKDTHAQLIKKRYEAQGLSVVIRSHPSFDHFFGRLSKQALLGRGTMKKIKASLFYALDVLHSVRYFYQKGDSDVLIMVRYLIGTAYLPRPIVKLGYTFFECFVPTSEYMFFLDADPEVLYERVQKRQKQEMFETLASLKRVHEKAMPLLKGWYIVDTSGSIQQTFSQIQEVLNLLDKREGELASR